MDNFANYRYTFGKNRLGKQSLGDFTIGNLTLCNFIYHLSIYQRYFTLCYGIKKNLFNDYYYSDLHSDICVNVLYTKKDKFPTKIAYVQN